MLIILRAVWEILLVATDQWCFGSERKATLASQRETVLLRSAWRDNWYNSGQSTTPKFCLPHAEQRQRNKVSEVEWKAKRAEAFSVLWGVRCSHDPCRFIFYLDASFGRNQVCVCRADSLLAHGNAQEASANLSKEVVAVKLCSWSKGMLRCKYLL